MGICGNRHGREEISEGRYSEVSPLSVTCHPSLEEDLSLICMLICIRMDSGILLLGLEFSSTTDSTIVYFVAHHVLALATGSRVLLG